MSNLKKQYTIEISLDAARLALDEAIARLSKLDAQLEGLDKDSAAAKAIISEMGKAAKAVEQLSGQVGSLETKLDNLKPGTIGALRQEFAELKKALDKTAEGSQEAERLLVRMGEVKGSIRGLKDETNALDPEKRINGFNNFASGVVGAYGICVSAAQTFGLESSVADEFVKKTQGVITILQSLEAIRAATDGETLKSIRSTLALGKAYVTAGEGASTGSKVTRAALISTGIGAIIVLVGILVANWDRLTASVKGSEAFFTKVKAITNGLFDSAIASVKNIAGVIGKLFDGDFSGAAAKAKNIGKELGAAYAKGYEESIFESNRKVFEAQTDALARQSEVLKSQGRNTFKEEEEILKRRLTAQKQGTEDEKKQYLDLQKDLSVLRAANAKKEKEDAQAATLARLDGQIALEEAKGQEAFNKQLAREKQQLANLKGAADPNDSAIVAQQDKIALIIAQHKAQQDEKKRIALVQAQQDELALLDKQGKDTLSLRIAFAEELLALDHDTTEKQKIQRDADFQSLLLLQIEQNNREKEIIKANREQQQQYEENDADVKIRFMTAAGEAATTAYVDGITKAATEAQARKTDIGRRILEDFFGVKPENVDKIKKDIADAYAAVSQVAQQVSDAIFSSQISAADAQIAATQSKLQLIDQQLQASQGAAEKAEAEAGKSSGARRDYYIQQATKQRAETERLASAKHKAAEEEKQQLKDRAQLEKESQRVSLSLTAAKAVEAAVSAIASAAEVPFPANIPAILIAGATVASAVVAGKALGNTFADGTGALGEDGVLRGPSHAAGGVALFSRSGHYYGEAEGGEAISPVSSSRNNAAALELIRTAGRTRVLTPADFAQIGNVRVLGPPATTFANGTAALGSSLQAAGMVAVSSADLSALLDTNKQMLAHLSAVAEHTKDVRDFGPPITVYGPEESIKRREVDKRTDETVAAVRL